MVSIPSRAFSSLAVRARLPDRPTCTKSHQRPKTGESRQRFDAAEGPSGVQSASLDISNESGLVTLPWHRSAPLWPVTAQCPHIHASCFAQISPCKHTVPHAVCIALDTTQTQREAHPQPQDVVFFPSQWWFPRSSKGCAASVQSNRTFEDIGGGKRRTCPTSFRSYFCHAWNAIMTTELGRTNKQPLVKAWRDEVGSTMQSAAAALLESNGVQQQQRQWSSQVSVVCAEWRAEAWNSKLFPANTFTVRI